MGTLQLAASGGTWLWGDAGPGPTQALALACLSPWILLTLLEFHFQVSSGLVNLLATHSISLSRLCDSECTVAPSVDAQGTRAVAENAALSGEVSRISLPPDTPLSQYLFFGVSEPGLLPTACGWENM